ncbi:MAG: hypothetical protein A2X55_09105 [Nitrospirae bacterium GWB2_47_37]|nr:MAG: hypothetical protein A2X55_09105 [Nitrospirae bacterium GWB2_47_37]HAK87669.1 hypothetical protein [Nitrospiraceae bacterium]
MIITRVIAVGLELSAFFMVHFFEKYLVILFFLAFPLTCWIEKKLRKWALKDKIEQIYIDTKK